MTKLKSVTRIGRAPAAPAEVPEDALVLIEIAGRVYRLTLGELGAGGGAPAPGNLYLADGTSNTLADVEYVDNQYQFVSADYLVCQGGVGTLAPYAFDGSTPISAPLFRPFATSTPEGRADAVAFTTPVHGIVVMGEEFAVTGGTVTMVVTNNVVSATFTPD